MQDQSLAKLDEVLLAIEAATTVQEIKSTIDAAIAIGVYTKQAKLGRDIELKASEYILRAERKLGEMLAAAKAAGQISRGNKTGNNQYESGNVPKENNSTFTLDQAGIDRKLSMTAQKIAAIPSKDFEKKIAEGKESGKLTSKTVIKSAQSDGAKPPKPKPEVVKPEVTAESTSEKPVQPTMKSPDLSQEPFKHKLEDEIMALHDAGLTLSQIEDRVGLGRSTRDHYEKGEIRRFPRPVRGDLSLTAQQKFDLAVKQEKNRLGITFDAIVQKKVNERMKLLLEGLTPKLKAEQEEAQRIIIGRRGIMTKKAYKKIRDCLHPDRALHPARETDGGLKKAYEDASHVWRQMERFVLDEKDARLQWIGRRPLCRVRWRNGKRRDVKLHRNARLSMPLVELIKVKILERKGSNQETNENLHRQCLKPKLG